MADSVEGVKIVNQVFWKDNVKSRKRMFENIRRYKKAISSIDTLKLKMSGITETKNKIKELKKEVVEVQKASMMGPPQKRHADVMREQKKGFVGPLQPKHADVERERKRSLKEATDTHKQALSENAAMDKAIADKQKAFDNQHKQAIRENKARQRAADEQHAQAIRENNYLNKVGADKQKAFDDAHKAALKENNALDTRTSKILRFSLLPNLELISEKERELLLLKLKSLKTTREVTDEIAKQTAEVRSLAKRDRDRTRQLNKQNFAQERATASMKQMAGAAFSVFTVMESIGAIAKTGMNFQAVSNTMKAVSKDSKEMKENISFIRGEARRLGADLVETSKSYSRILAAGAGKVPLKDLRDLTSGVLETAAVLGLSADDTTGTLRALSQMLSKGKVTAEELNQQLGDRAPVAIGIFKEAAKEAGLITNTMNGEFEKLMASGKLTVDKILPNVAKGFHKWAAKGLPDALKSFRTVLGRSKLDLQDFQDALFGRGVESGLTFLLSGFSDLMKSSKTLAALLGGIFKGAVVGLVAPFRLVYSAIFDITKLLGLHDSDGLKAGIAGTATAISGLVTTVLSLAAALWAAKKAWAFMKGIRKLPGKIRGTSKAAKELVGGKASGGGLLSGGVQNVFVTNMPSGGLGGDVTGGGKSKGSKGFFGGKVGQFLGMLPALATIPAQFKIQDTQNELIKKLVASQGMREGSFKLEQLYKPQAQTFSKFAPRGGFQYGTQAPQKVDVNVNVKHDTPMFRTEVENISDDRISQSYSTSY